jgi:hypothetical protein
MIEVDNQDSDPMAKYRAAWHDSLHAPQGYSLFSVSTQNNNQ